jgi:hypothetical protein
VEIMPLNESILGFSNRWYPEGFEQTIDIEIEPNLYVKIFSPLYFIASKLEAFKNRGGVITEPVLILRILLMYWKTIRLSKKN